MGLDEMWKDAWARGIAAGRHPDVEPEPPVEAEGPTMVRCLCYHRRWLHEGRSMACTMAGCNCHMFVERVEPESEKLVESQ